MGGEWEGEEEEEEEEDKGRMQRKPWECLEAEFSASRPLLGPFLLGPLAISASIGELPFEEAAAML